MTEITLAGCDPWTLLSHAALYGLAAILESTGASDVRACWTTEAKPRPRVSFSGFDDAEAAALVLAHAQASDADGSWVQQQINLGGTGRGLMSPRLSSFKEESTWDEIQRLRHEVLESLTREHRWLDLGFLNALGEPCYWRFNRKGDRLQDDGASRLEMQPRNQGSEFVGNRLRKLAEAVADRDPSQILTGLRGEHIVDEIANDRSDSRTPTGLASPGPTDNALAWCALWGISQFPTTMQMFAAADTAGHLRFGRNEWFYVPVWHQEWRPARVRSILASRSLRVLASDGLEETIRGSERRPYSVTEVCEARAWLDARHAAGVIRFPIERFGSVNAPERRAMGGETISALASSGIVR